jgi:hypothetical protein
MNLTDLEPRWIHPNVFVFLCPHCREVLLTCKNVEMSQKEQRHLFEKEFGDDWNMLVIPSNSSTSWHITGTKPQDSNSIGFHDISVTPSIDASASGHWHGFITNGEIN